MSEDNKDKIIEVTAQPVSEEMEQAVVKGVPEEGMPLEEDHVTTKKGILGDEILEDEVASKIDAEQAERQLEKAKKKAEEERKTEEQIDKIEKALLDQAQEGEKKHSSNFTFTKIIAGDVLSAQVLRNNIFIFVLIVFFMIIYVTNRYAAQKDLIEIDKLNTELQDAKYRALASSSQLTEKTRESHILELLKNSKDSVLKISDRPPYIIDVPE